MNTTTNSSAKPAKTHLGVADKLTTILDAWENLAPEAKFADLTLADFRIATSGTTETRRKLVTNRAGICSLVSSRMVREAALSAALKRVSAAVLVDERYGSDSALYRAMGYVRTSERKSPSATVAAPSTTDQTGASATPTSSSSTPEGSPAGSKSRQKPLLDRFKEMVAAWEDAQEEVIGGLRIGDWKPAGEALEATKQGLVEARIERRALVGTKKQADVATLALIKRVVANVIASSAYGENSALYRGMGYVPGNERKSPSRKAAVPAAA